MTEVKEDICVDLVRSIADEIAVRGNLAGGKDAISDTIAHVRAVSAAAETSMRSALAGLYPSVGWTKEEGRPGDGNYWLYDPIDGAYHWLQGLPLWASSLVLVRGGEPVLSIVYDPSMQEMFVARRGSRANCNGQPIRVSPKSNLSAAVVGSAVPPVGQVGEEEQDDALRRICRICRPTPSFNMASTRACRGSSTSWTNIRSSCPHS
jgi:myo-inositol-1(or 4)-monophosphatase